jgi:hypothetical protein
MAIQLARWRLHHDSVATYESAMTRQFQKGRTETIRVCSREAAAFVRVGGIPGCVLDVWCVCVCVCV